MSMCWAFEQLALLLRLHESHSPSGFSRAFAIILECGRGMNTASGASIPSMTSQATSRRGPHSARHQGEGQEAEQTDRIP